MIKVTALRRTDAGPDSQHETAAGAFNPSQVVSIVEVESTAAIPIVGQLNILKFTIIYLAGQVPPMKVVETRDQLLDMMEALHTAKQNGLN